jgi:flagellar L-ring protein precursor FlgH
MYTLKSIRRTLLRTHILLDGAVLLLLILIQGCASPPEQGELPPSPDYSQYPAAPVATSGGLYKAGYELSLFSDVKATRVGDIVTVMLVEQNSGQKSSDTNLNQSTDVNVGAPTFGGSSHPNLAITLDSANSFVGEAGSSQSNRLNGSIAVTVREVLPSGNLLVEGEKWIQINQGNELIRLRGVVRPRDVGPNNVIYSTQVADARISYSGTGTQPNTNMLGWAARFVFSPLWPF